MSEQKLKLCEEEPNKVVPEERYSGYSSPFAKEYETVEELSKFLDTCASVDVFVSFGNSGTLLESRCKNPSIHYGKEYSTVSLLTSEEILFKFELNGLTSIRKYSEDGVVARILGEDSGRNYTFFRVEEHSEDITEIITSEI